MSQSSPRKTPTIFQSLTLAALGIVFGDIGTSPLYALREAFHGPHAIPLNPQNILGVLSMIVWSLVLVISAKYFLVVMKADNRGEGGVLALSALAFPPRLVRVSRLSRTIFYLGLFGSSLLVGDAVITPAISVLSAVEGLQVATPLFTPYVLPITLAILALLFFGQHQGTARIGAIFGVVVLIWFFAIGALGIYSILQDPQVLWALNPIYAVQYFMENGMGGFIVLGAVFLAVTGGEALYADMGHFGKKPIQRAWFSVVFPGLVLNYFGQGALLLSSPESAPNPFYFMAPSWSVLPMVALATFATVIASQAVISGIFSMARQAIQLGYAPRFKIVHTSSQEIGQIYIPNVNWALFVAVCWLVLEFKTSSAMAAAYGIAVSATMIITTILAASVAVRLWRWSWMRVVLTFSIFVFTDFAFLGSNFFKIADGGWFPLTVGVMVFTLMTTWRRGRQILMQRLREKSIPFSTFVQQIAMEPPTRVRGTAFFMTGDPEGTPPALLHNVRHNKVLHQRNVLMTVLTKDVPHVPPEGRVDVIIKEENFFRIIANYGFMEMPDIHEILRACAQKDLNFQLEDITFFLGRETLIASERPGMAIWREKLFAFMSKNAERATAYFNIPPHQVVEVGLQVEI